MVKQKRFNVIILLYIQYLSFYKHVLSEKDNLRNLEKAVDLCTYLNWAYWHCNTSRMEHMYLSNTILFVGRGMQIIYKVVQIWPGLTAACLHTNQSRSYLNHLVLRKVQLHVSALDNGLLQVVHEILSKQLCQIYYVLFIVGLGG